MSLSLLPVSPASVGVSPGPLVIGRPVLDLLLQMLLLLLLQLQLRGGRGRGRGAYGGVPASAAVAPDLGVLVPETLLVLLELDPRPAGHVPRAVDGGQRRHEDDAVADHQSWKLR